jgi:hypothetical protein
VNELLEAKHQPQLRRVLARRSRHDLIAIDKVGYVPPAEVGAEFCSTSWPSGPRKRCDHNDQTCRFPSGSR